MNEFFEKRYQYLYGAAINICNKNMEMSKELLSHCIELVYNNPGKDMISSLEKEDDRNTIRVFTRIMSNQWRWYNSTFRKESCKETLLTEYQEELLCDEGEQEQEILLDSESTNHSTKMYLQDLMSQGLSQSQARKMIVIQNVVSKLPKHERIIYELYFVQGKSGRDISKEFSKKIKMPVNSVYAIITSIKNKIKAECRSF